MPALHPCLGWLGGLLYTVSQRSPEGLSSSCPHGSWLEACLYLLPITAATHPHALVIKTTCIYYLIILWVRSQKWAKDQGVSRVHSILEALVRSISLPFLSSRGCPHSLACGSFFHLQSQQRWALRVHLKRLSPSIMPSFIFSPLSPSSIFKDSWDYVGPMWIMLDILLTLRSSS